MTAKRSAYVSKSAVRSARTAAGLTQSEAAALLGFSVRAWQAWELGTRRMRAVLLESFKINVESARSPGRRAHDRPRAEAHPRGRV